MRVLILLFAGFRNDKFFLACRVQYGFYDYRVQMEATRSDETPTSNGERRRQIWPLFLVACFGGCRHSVLLWLVPGKRREAREEQDTTRPRREERSGEGQNGNTVEATRRNFVPSRPSQSINQSSKQASKLPEHNTAQHRRELNRIEWTHRVRLDCAHQSESFHPTTFTHNLDKAVIDRQGQASTSNLDVFPLQR